MKLLTEPRTAAPVSCPYLPNREFVQDYFFATALDEHEFEVLLASGWRRFGSFFFRPACPGCQQCIPIRLDAKELKPSRSQRRIRSRGRDIVMDAVEPRPTDEAWIVYRSHSLRQFGRTPNREDFEHVFFDNAVPALQTEYRLNGQLVGLGFLDIGSDGFSSVYYSFHSDAARWSLGTLSIIDETELARRNGRRWYYLGYWVPGCETMEYKARFSPHQLLDWETGEWAYPKEEQDAEIGDL